MPLVTIRHRPPCNCCVQDETNTSDKHLKCNLFEIWGKIQCILGLRIRRNYFCTIVLCVYFIIRGHIANVFHVFNTYKHEDMRWPRLAHNVYKCRLGILFFCVTVGCGIKNNRENLFEHFNIFEFFQRFYLSNLIRKFLKVLNAITVARLNSREISA